MNNNELEFFLLKAKNLNLKGSAIVTLGVQGLHIKDFYELRKLMLKYGVLNNDISISECKYNNITKYGKTINQDTMFKMLGCNRIDSIDISSKEEPTYTIDIGSKILESLYDTWDVLIDFGTLEHIYNIPAALNNISKIVKSGGQIIHLNPISGSILHGYYQISPNLYKDFYNEINYTISECNILVHKQFGYSYYFDYNFDSLPLDFRGNISYIYINIKKNAGSISTKIPKGSDVDYIPSKVINNYNYREFVCINFPKISKIVIPPIRNILEIIRIIRIKKNWIK
ncbi:hypothetical protein [Polynucleobacter sp. CS-Odin-A6]|uniref:hypothetical protein n=1 Tax=Polynucleobacter sp. CS-Odin-A6 TaxID=2689106 RepID=UPI001C0D8378|nr:hypothetical protein [Polynucleobacter sp. CS-Odin-A6]MBU3621109.1 hypothetical protein [Polynucleobacter sp. CS-Odin-A6]